MFLIPGDYRCYFQGDLCVRPRQRRVVTLGERSRNSGAVIETFFFPRVHKDTNPEGERGLMDLWP